MYAYLACDLGALRRRSWQFHCDYSYVVKQVASYSAEAASVVGKLMCHALADSADVACRCKQHVGRSDGWTDSQAKHVSVRITVTGQHICGHVFDSVVYASTVVVLDMP